jgi:hypothetical protein
MHCKKNPRSHPQQKKRKKGEFAFDVSGNLDNKKLSVDNPRLSVELDVSVLDADRIKIQFLPSIDKSKLKSKLNVQTKK